jgi:hypothetical protein
MPDHNNVASTVLPSNQQSHFRCGSGRGAGASLRPEPPLRVMLLQALLPALLQTRLLAFMRVFFHW